MKVSKFFFSYWESILVTIGILYMSFAPPSKFESIPKFSHADKIMHIAMYFALTIVLIYDFWKKNKGQFRSGKFVCICILFPVLLGGIVEILQGLFFKPRSADWFDWFADGVGVLLAYLLIFLFLRKQRDKLSD